MFTGREYDAETGLYYYRARCYDPAIGRFLQTDPIGYKGGINLYSYCSNNPIIYVDPLGLDYWIEGPSSGEPAGHQSINVGDPNGEYNSYSYGVNGKTNLRHGLEGEVYRDPLKGGIIDANSYQKTTPAEDGAIKAQLESGVGRTGAYTPWSTCRNYSQNEYDRLVDEGYGQKSNPPLKSNPANLPSSQVPSVSSTVVSSKPHGPVSGATKKCKK